MNQNKNNKPDLTTREGVAAILEESDLFYHDLVCPNCFGAGNSPDYDMASCSCCNGEGKLSNQILSANQSKAILAQLDVQVVWYDPSDCYEIGFFTDLDSTTGYYWYTIDKLPDIPSKDIELALAAGVAWFCVNEPEKLTFLKK